MSGKKIAVVLAGCGVYDGSEIHEATMTLLAIKRRGSEYQCFAPDIEQAHVINHLNGEVLEEKRNVLVESARIARGDVKPLSEYNAEEYDAIVFPGGFGVAKNLSTLAFDGAECTVNKDVENALKANLSEKKPIGALCISPAVIAKVLPGAEVTIGSDAGTAETISKMKGIHHETDHAEVIIDEKYRLVTTPCYMLDATIVDVAEGADACIDSIFYLIENGVWEGAKSQSE